MKQLVVSLALLAGLALALPASAQSTVSTYKKVKMCVGADKMNPGKTAEVEGTLNLDADSKNVLFVVNESVKKTIPYQNISSLEFYMADHKLRIYYRNGNREDSIVDLDLRGAEQPDLLKQLQAQTGIAVHLS